MIALQIHGKMVGTIRYRNIRIQEFPPLLASDFRLAPAAEGWEPSKTPVPFEGDTIRQADDPDEHGIRISKGQLMSKPFPVEPFAFYRLRFLAQASEKPLCAAVFLDEDGKQIEGDNHDCIDASTDWKPYSLCFRGHGEGREARSDPSAGERRPAGGEKSAGGANHRRRGNRVGRGARRAVPSRAVRASR